MNTLNELVIRIGDAWCVLFGDFALEAFWTLMATLIVLVLVFGVVSNVQDYMKDRKIERLQKKIKDLEESRKNLEVKGVA